MARAVFSNSGIERRKRRRPLAGAPGGLMIRPGGQISRSDQQLAATDDQQTQQRRAEQHQ